MKYVILGQLAGIGGWQLYIDARASYIGEKGYDVYLVSICREKDIALSCKNISSFINILSTDFGKIQIYQKDTGGYSIPKSNSQLELFDDLFSNIIINQETKKTLKDYLIEEYQKKLEKEEKTVNNNEKRS